MKEIRKNDAELKEQPAVDVVIDGKVIPLSGGETEYLQRVAGYLDGKISELKRSQQYGHQNAEQRSMTLSLNLAGLCTEAGARGKAHRDRAHEGASHRFRGSTGGDRKTAV